MFFREDENNENCNEDEGNDAYEGWSDFFARHGSIVNDCKTALSYFQKKIGRNDSEFICNETNNKLIKASVKGEKEPGKSMLKSMVSSHVTKLPLVTDQNPAKIDETFGEVCKCTCKKGTLISQQEMNDCFLYKSVKITNNQINSNF